ncbi:MAG: hypothetical protein AAGF11_20615 [Myxococcota bacterium]
MNRVDDNTPVTVICRYQVKLGQGDAMEALLRRHWRGLREVGLVTDTPVRIFRGVPSDKPGEAQGAARTYVEIFEWVSARAPQIAHETPAVMAVWESMGALCEHMDFPHYEPLAL